MLRPLAFLGAVVGLVAALWAPSATLAAPPRVPAAVPLARGWDFAFDRGDVGLRDRWSQGAGAPRYRGVTVPHVFDGRPDKSQFHGTTGWYRLRFTAPKVTPGFQWALRFEQARRVATVWLNGHELGTNRDPYVPFTLPATGLRPGQANTLVVRVDNHKGKEPREGWWNWGGLTRRVTLVPRGALELQSPGLMPTVHCDDGGTNCRAGVHVDGTLVNRSGGVADHAQVTVRLDPPGGGAPVFHTAAVRTLAPGDSARVQFDFAVDDPKLWSPADPQLYGAEIDTGNGNTPTQVDRMRIGLRGVSVKDGTLSLNGRQLDLRGAAIQEDMPGHGPALTDADIKTIVAELKAVHANVTRAQYPLDERLLDALDAAGIMVWSQAPIYHRDRQLETQAQRDLALATLRGTVIADRSHPSVLTHSVANELSVIPDRVAGTRAYLDAALAEARDLDPTLPIGVDLLSYPGYGAQQTYAKFDLLGINSYFGWYPGKRAHPTGNLDDLGPYLDHMRAMYPRQALVVTEFGAESTRNGPADRKQTYAFQADYVRRVLDIIARRPFVGGAIYWTLREFAVKPDWDGGAHPAGPRDSIHHKGLITYAGRRKPAWSVAEGEFAATPLYRKVSAAQAANRPAGGSGGSAVLLWLIAAGVLAIIVVDAWALRGIARSRRNRAAGRAADTSSSPTPPSSGGGEQRPARSAA